MLSLLYPKRLKKTHGKEKWRRFYKTPADPQILGKAKGFFPVRPTPCPPPQLRPGTGLFCGARIRKSTPAVFTYYYVPLPLPYCQVVLYSLFVVPFLLLCSLRRRSVRPLTPSVRCTFGGRATLTSTFQVKSLLSNDSEQFKDMAGSGTGVCGYCADFSAKHHASAPPRDPLNSSPYSFS